MAHPHALLTAINMLLDESSAGSMTEANQRLDDILDPGPGVALPPQYALLRLTSALLGRLLAHRDYETWDEEDCDNTDGLLREIISQAVQLRPLLVAGEPDLPTGAEVQARADQLLMPVPSHTDGSCLDATGDCQADPDDEDAARKANRAIRMLAATVQAFEDAGLHDGSHFVNMAAHVWGMPKHL